MTSCDNHPSSSPKSVNTASSMSVTANAVGRQSGPIAACTQMVLAVFLNVIGVMPMVFNLVGHGSE